MKVIKEMRIVEAEGILKDGFIRWACEKSPTKHCQYDELNDLAMDDCIHCHEPLERK